MYFKRIEMHGFKSFADPVTIEFHEGITCIVGPNGSGKSNISDAVRWVLGEQSPKMLRGGKMEEVIFAGTESRKSRGMAEVTLVLDNSEGILPIDYNEVAIARRMYRSGESEYCINDNQCRLRDIRELIMDTGIGVDGYSLIGQGRISDIISNKTESRREIFEEAAGIVMYRTKKAESERKLKSTSENLERINDIIGEIEGRIGGLKEDCEKAEEYVRLRDRLKELEINITLKNIDSIELKNEYVKDDLMEIQILLDEQKEEKEQLEKNLLDSRARNEELDRLQNEEKDKLLINVEAINKLASRKRLADERREFIKQNRGRLTCEIEQLKERIEKEKVNSANVFKQKKAMDGEEDAFNKALKEKTEEHSQLIAESAEIFKKIEELKSKLFGAHGSIAGKQAEIDSMDALNETLEKRRTQISSEQAAGEGSNHDTLDALNRARNELDDFKAEKEHLKRESDELAVKKTENVKNEKELLSQIRQIDMLESQFSARKKTIEEMENNYEGYNNAVRYIMKQNLSGVEGVVAELIVVPEGMETAIETALGGALQNIVCTDDISAKNAVNILKHNRAGRLTFLPADSIKAYPLRDDKVEASRGFIGYGDECVKYDDRYGKVMKYLLGRVAFIDTMDNAVNMFKFGIKGLRLVTLDGEIINAGGAITGGKHRNKTADLLGRRAEITELEKQIEGLRNRRKVLSADLLKVRTDLKNAEAGWIVIEKKLRTIEKGFLEKEAEISGFEALLADLKTGREKYERELSDIEDEQKLSDEMTLALRNEIEQLKNGMSETEAEIAKLQVEADGKKEAADHLSEQITSVRIEAETVENKKTHLNELVERVKASIREFEFEINAKEAQLSELNFENTELDSSYTDIDGFLKEKELLKKNQESYIKDLSVEKDELTSEIKEMSMRMSVLDEELRNSSDMKYKLEIKKAKQETQLDNLKNKIWEEYEISYMKAVEMKKQDFVMVTSVKESRGIKARIKELGDVNVGAIKEYEAVSERYAFLTVQRDDILGSMHELRKIISDMDKVIKEKFKKNFNDVVVNFEQIFKELFGGGHAQLLLEDESDPLESPIEIVAQPPGKALKNINLLSGGEKSMTAIALMFAVLKTKPTPFCILDEVEAALDDTNIKRFANYLKTSFDDIQFALVTHKKATMEYADVLYGVTMPEHGVSKILSLKLGDEFEGAEK